MTKTSNFRLTDATLADLDVIADQIGSHNRTDAIRRSAAWLASEIRANRPVAPAVPEWSPRSIPTTIGDWS